VKEIEVSVKEVEQTLRDLKVSDHPAIRSAAKRIQSFVYSVDDVEHDLLVALELCSSMNASKPWHIPGREKWISGTKAAVLCSVSMNAHDDALIAAQLHHRPVLDLERQMLFELAMMAHTMLCRFEMIVQRDASLIAQCA
jgi:hypothetical protein